jgi:hypothetical protein
MGVDATIGRTRIEGIDMRLLLIGGTVFLGRHVIDAALARHAA